MSETVATDSEFDHTPALPYNGTSGRGGSDASHEAKAREDADGTTSARQQRVLSLLADAGALGLTTADLSARTGFHHGQASGALSVLHKDGQIARLAVGKRAKQSVYVALEHVNGRAVARHGGKAPGERIVAAPGTPTDPAPRRVVTLSEAEIDLLDKARSAVRNHPSDKPNILVRKTTLAALIDLLDRALGN